MQPRASRRKQFEVFWNPRGGVVSSLKGDLIKLCHLLHLNVASNDTVDTLKEKSKPMLAILKVNPADKSKAKAKPLQIRQHQLLAYRHLQDLREIYSKLV